MSNTEPIENTVTTPPAVADQLPRYISRHQAATDCGVTRGAVIRWLKEGKVKIVADRDRIDRFSADYLYCKQKAQAKKETVGPSAPKSQKAKTNAPKKQAKRAQPSPMAVQQMFFGSKQDADIAKLREQIIQLQLKNDQARDKLISRELVEKVFAEFYSIESTEMLSLGDKLSSEIAALARVDQPEIVIEISQLIRASIAKALEHISIIMNRFTRGLHIDNSEEEDGSEDS
jgi:hypothetical protein